MDSLSKYHIIFLITFFVYIFLFQMSEAISETSPFTISETKQHTETIEFTSPDEIVTLGGTHEYTIDLNGTVDMDNTSTIANSMYDVAFQPNISLEIKNTGSTPVINPWIVINGVRDWRNIDTMLEEATRGAASAQDSIMLLYEFVKSNRIQDSPQFRSDELHDPVKHFNCYSGMCDDIGRVTGALAYRAGFNKKNHGGNPMGRQQCGHYMIEVMVNGHYEFLDTSINAFYLGPDNEFPVSGKEIVRDHDLVHREYAFGAYVYVVG